MGERVWPPSEPQGEACTVVPASLLGAAPLPPSAMVPRLLICKHEAWVGSMQSGKCIPDDRSIGLLKMTWFTCCLVKSMAETPRRDGRKEAFLFLSKWEGLRSGRTTVASPKVLESVSEPHILEIIGDAITYGSCGEDPQGVGWRRVTLSPQEADKAGWGEHLLLMD